MMVFYVGYLLTIALLSISVTILRDHISHQNLKDKTPKNVREMYDYIIVGGGTAGSIVAGRLSENRNLRILVLEEGDVEQVSNDIPAMDVMNVLQPTTQLNQYLTVPQTHALFGFPYQQINILTARLLGGGSSINGMMYNRGGPGDYNGWEFDYGAEGWSYEDVLPFFRKSEDQTDPNLRRRIRYHGTGGPMTITTPDVSQATAPYRLLGDTFINGAAELGYKETDINGMNQVGTSRIQRTIRDGKRLSTASAFLKPGIDRKNLFIITGALVTKVYFQDKRVDGVQYRRNGRTYFARVNRNGEIILCAGAINSAKILLLSGIGPRQHLDDLGIPVVADLPVGRNFHDHTRSGGVDFVVNSTLFSFWQDLLTVENLELLYVNGTGPLASQFYLHQAAVINYKTSVPGRGAFFGPSDVMIAPAILPPGQILLTGGEPTLNKDIIEKYYGPYFGQPTLNIFSCLNYVRSRGQVKLRSRNPFHPPLVDPAYLTNFDDMSRLIEAYKFSMDLGKTEAFKRIGAKPYEHPLPGCEVYFNPDNIYDQSEEYIQCKIRHLTASELHVCGTAKMGSPDDNTVVVDSRLRVLGDFKGLRVADASVMPSVPTGNLMAPVMMIAEKAATMIAEDRENRVNSENTAERSNSAF